MRGSKFGRDEMIESVHKIKRSMNREFLIDLEKAREVDKMKVKKTISKNEAIMIADVVKSGMSIEVMKDLADLKKTRSRFQMAA